MQTKTRMRQISERKDGDAATLRHVLRDELRTQCGNAQAGKSIRCYSEGDFFLLEFLMQTFLLNLI